MPCILSLEMSDVDMTLNVLTEGLHQTLPITIKFQICITMLWF